MRPDIVTVSRYYAQCSYFDSIEAEQTFSAENSNTRVRTVITKGPKSQITDVALFKAGIEAEEMIKGTANVSEPFDPSFRKCAKPERYFTVGRVFHMLWTDPPGSDPTYEHETVKSSKPSRSISATTSEVRCFVVIRPGKNYCSALPIVTYGGRGVASRQVIKHHHATISTSPKGPGCEGDENPRPGELGMLNLHVMVEPDHRAAKLNRMSRIDFGHVCSIEHEVNVKPFGTVSAESGEKLSRCFREVCTSIVAQRAGPGSQQSSSTDGNIDGRQARLREMMRLEQIQRIKLTREEEALMRSQRERTKGDGPESSRKSSDRARKVSDDQPEENDSDDPDNEDDDDEKEDDDNDDHDHDYKDKSRVQANQRANKEDEDSQSDDTKDDRLEERLSPQYAILRLYKSLRDRDMEDEDALRLTLRMSVSKGYTLEQAQRALATISRGRGRASNSPRRLEGVRRVDSGTQDPVVVEFRTLCTNGRSPRDALRYMSQTGRYTAEQLGDLISTIRSSG
nr:hypothetical protein B0A51_14463 [Rachicladosporium sp. CCFEE 5018]